MAQLNLTIAGRWSGLGLLSGMVLGLGFIRARRWGSGAVRDQRLYQLSHFSFLGLGLVAILFYLSAQAHLSPKVDNEACCATTALAATYGF